MYNSIESGFDFAQPDISEPNITHSNPNNYI